MPIQGNMFNQRQSYAKPPAKSQFMQQQLGSLFYPQGSQRPNLQTATQRSMLPNPIAPAVADARANAQFMQTNPGFATSSLDATQRFGGMTANNAFQSGMVNGYVGQTNPMVPFNEAASRARNMEQVQRGVLPAERGGSYGRFGQGGALGPGSAYAQSGGTPWQEQYFNDQRERRQAADYATSQGAMAQRLQTQMPTDRAQNVFTKRQADGSLAYTDRLTALRNADPNTPGLADAISLEEGKREAAKQRMDQRLQDYKDKNAGMSPRQMRRAKLQTQREDNRMNKAIMRGMNPMSPQATALFPEASARFQDNMKKQKGVADKPQVADNPFRSGGTAGSSSPTAEDKAKAKAYRTTAAQGGMSPDGTPVPRNEFIAATGVTGEEDNIQDIHFGIQQQVQNNTNPSVEDLKVLRGYVQGLDSEHRTPSYDPFDMTYGFEGWDTVDQKHTTVFGPMYKELAELKDPSDQQLLEWWGKFKSRIAPDVNRFTNSGVSTGGHESPLQNPMVR